MLLDRLKAETRPAHDRIERDLNLSDRTIAAAPYRALLARFYGFHSTWEAEAEAHLGDPAIVRDRLKTPLLVKDLQALGASVEAISTLPICRPILRVPTRASALGAMYVVEGSTLGGSVIAHRVKRVLNLGPETGCAYFGSYGRDVGRKWKAFGAHLLAASNPIADDLIVAAANETFECMRAWLCQDGAAG